MLRRHIWKLAPPIEDVLHSFSLFAFESFLPVRTQDLKERCTFDLDICEFVFWSDNAMPILLDISTPNTHDRRQLQSQQKVGKTIDGGALSTGSC